MRSGAADDRSQSYYSIILAGLNHLLRNQWNFESAGYPGGRDIAFFYAVPDKPVHSAADQLADDELVKSGRYNTDLHVFFCYNFSFK